MAAWRWRQVWCERVGETKSMRKVRRQGLCDGPDTGMCVMLLCILPTFNNAAALQIGPGRYGTSRAMCTDCSGQGEKLREKDWYVPDLILTTLRADVCSDSCKKCKGKKTVKEKTRQEIFIERGMADRQRIVLSGAGDEEVCPQSVISQCDVMQTYRFLARCSSRGRNLSIEDASSHVL